MAWKLGSHFYSDKNVDKVASIRIKNNDVFKLQFLYDRMHDWFVEEGWASGKAPDFGETLFRVFNHPNGAKDYRIEWRFERKNFSKFVHATWDVDFNILFLSDVEIVHNGKKIKTNKCDCDINMVVRLIIDPGNIWKNHFILKHFYNVWINRIYYHQIDQFWDMVYRDAYALQQTIKDYWKFKRWVDEPEFGAYDKPKGLPDYGKGPSE